MSDGRSARILGEVSNGASLLIAVAFKKGDALGSEVVGLFDHTGAPQWQGCVESLRLVNASKQITTVTRYAYVFEDNFFFTAKTTEYRNLSHYQNRHGELVAIVPVTLTVTEGEGL